MVGIIKEGGPLSVAGGFCEQGLADPILDSQAHLLESSFEEVISGFDADQFLGVGEGVD